MFRSWKYGLLNSKTKFLRRSIFNENLVAGQLNKTEIYLNKPIYVRFAVLEISKILMCQFHYDYMLSKYGNEKCKLLYMDTDSLVYEIECDDIYLDIKNSIHKFDTITQKIIYIE